MSVKLSRGSISTASAPEENPNLFADLVERIAARADRDAFARLFAWYAPRLKSHLMRLGADPAQAEDQALDVMAAVWRQAVRFDRTETSVATWIFRIARNRRLGAPRPHRGATTKLTPVLAGEGRTSAKPARMQGFSDLSVSTTS